MTPLTKIEGRVIGLGSKAVKGIEVRPFIRGMSQSRIVGFHETSGITYTDADGRFIIWINAKEADIQHFSVLCSDQKRNLVGFRDITMQDKHPTISVEPGIRIIGLLQDQNGNALVDTEVTVSFSAKRDMGSATSSYQVRTLQDGQFIVSAIPSDWWACPKA